MATESKEEQVRMFVALDLPQMVREDIAAWGEYIRIAKIEPQ